MSKYSQNEEQHFILKNTPLNGRFLDIGAWHAKHLSNTRALWENGWSGVMIEPSPGPMRGLLEEYGYDERITLVSAAVGVERGIIRLDITDNATSTADVRVYETWRYDPGTQYVGSLFVPVITVEDIINQFGAFDFVSIDAEGQSFDIFKRIITNPMHPACICVEHDAREIEILRAAVPAGYKPVEMNGENIVLAR